MPIPRIAGAPPRLEAVARHALARDPSARPSGPQAFAHELERALTTGSQGKTTFLALGLVAVLALGAFLAKRTTPKPPEGPSLSPQEKKTEKHEALELEARAHARYEAGDYARAREDATRAALLDGTRAGAWAGRCV